jgi:CheY-like chemotaxis protein
MNETQLSRDAGPLKTSHKKTILVVDDSPDMLELGKVVLESENFTVLTACCGNEALVLLQEEKPDLILLDMQLGDMTGNQFLELLEKQQPEMLTEVPVVFLTGTDKSDIPAGRASGYIKKATGVVTLIESVHHFLRLGPKSPLRG